MEPPPAKIRQQMTFIFNILNENNLQQILFFDKYMPVSYLIYYITCSVSV